MFRGINRQQSSPTSELQTVKQTAVVQTVVYIPGI